jgi:putative phosphoesterase
MLIGLISDTHIPEAGKDISPEVRAAFSDVDLILHGGDITVSRVLDQLEEIAPVIAAEGNHDEHLWEDPRIEPIHRLDLEGHSIALIHRFGPVEADIDYLVSVWLEDIRPDIVVCGDSHYTFLEWKDDVLVINPGSPTLPRNLSPRLGNVGLLELYEDQAPSARIIDLSDGANSHLLQGFPKFA